MRRRMRPGCCRALAIALGFVESGVHLTSRRRTLGRPLSGLLPYLRVRSRAARARQKRGRYSRHGMRTRSVSSRRKTAPSALSITTNSTTSLADS